NLGLLVTAEGVEDFAALTMLRDLGCDFPQGNALARTVPADHLAAACGDAGKTASAVLRSTAAGKACGSGQSTDDAASVWWSALDGRRLMVGAPQRAAIACYRHVRAAPR